jgi:hypothetical protein
MAGPAIPLAGLRERGEHGGQFWLRPSNVGSANYVLQFLESPLHFLGDKRSACFRWIADSLTKPCSRRWKAKRSPTSSRPG